MIETISSIVREFSVNENWLRTGEGEMFLTLTRDEEIAAFMGELLSSESNSFKHRLIAALVKLEESDWQALEKIAKLIKEED